MEFNVIVKIVIYIIIVRIIMSKVNKKKNMMSNPNKRKADIPKTYDMQKRTKIQNKQGDKNNNRGIDLRNIRNMKPRSGKPVTLEEKMKQREKELENMNKK